MYSTERYDSNIYRTQTRKTPTQNQVDPIFEMSYTNGKFAHVSDRDIAMAYSHRQATDCCAYLIPYLKPTFDILDVGCGPGSITKGLADLCPQGKTLGVDFSEEMIEQDRQKLCGPEFPNLSFEVANAEDLSQFADDSLSVLSISSSVWRVPSCSAL